MQTTRREIEPELKRCTEYFPVVTILGPRQSGKTTLAKMFFPLSFPGSTGESLLISKPVHNAACKCCPYNNSKLTHGCFSPERAAF